MKNKLPRPVYLAIFLFILGVICAGLLAVVENLTKEKIEENEREATEEANKLIVDFLSTDLSATEIVNITDNYKFTNERKNKISQAFSLKHGENSAFAFKCYEQNDFTEFYTLVVLENINGKYQVLRVKVLEEKGYLPTSLGSSKNNSFFDQKASNFGLVGSNYDNFNTSFQTIAGSTYSAKCVLKAVNTSFEQIGLIENLEG